MAPVKDASAAKATPAKEAPAPTKFLKIPYSATALTLEGETVSLEKFKGKLVFLVVWRTDCKACIIEIPILNRLQEEFSSEDFTVLGLSVDRGKDEFVKKVVEVRGINYPIWMGYDQPLIKYTPAQILPTLFTIGPGGEMLGYLLGAFPSYEHAVAVVKEARASAAKSRAAK
jgi:peroxiredoxin